MMKPKKVESKKSRMSTGKKIAIGAGVAAIGAGAYYFLGPKGKAHQKRAKDWAMKMEKKIEKKAGPVIKKAKKAVKKAEAKVKAIKKAMNK